MADAIRTKFDVESTLIEGDGGVFDVHINGKQIWDKKTSGRFPEHDEIFSQLKKSASGAG